MKAPPGDRCPSPPIWSVLALLLSLAACGGSDSAPPDPQQTSCGTGGALAGAECTGLATCGAGAQNFKRVQPCDHCFAGADSHVCEAGKCRAIPTTIDGYGTIRAAFSLNQVGSTAQGLAQAALWPVMADGTRLSCAALLSTCGYVENPAINALSSSLNVVQSGDVVYASTTMEPGAGRLYFAEFTSESRGRGTVLARGCAEGLTIAAGQTLEIEVQLSVP
jgi:hypothetical protein